MQAAIPAMWAVGAGSIINVASIFGVTGSEGYVAYTASKAAIIAMTLRHSSTPPTGSASTRSAPVASRRP
jgi:NAD(P)-dependent dehydrogenase (short-subunit alcohol dehydrogenase family)